MPFVFPECPRPPNKLLFISENLIISFTFSVEPFHGIVHATFYLCFHYFLQAASASCNTFIIALIPHLLLLICSYILLPHYGGSFPTFSLSLPQICIAFIIRKKLRKIEVTSIKHLLYVRHPSKIYMLIHLILSIPVR